MLRRSNVRAHQNMMTSVATDRPTGIDRSENFSSPFRLILLLSSWSFLLYTLAFPCGPNQWSSDSDICSAPSRTCHLIYMRSGGRSSGNICCSFSSFFWQHNWTSSWSLAAHQRDMSIEHVWWSLCIPASPCGCLMPWFINLSPYPGNKLQLQFDRQLAADKAQNSSYNDDSKGDKKKIKKRWQK